MILFSLEIAQFSAIRDIPRSKEKSLDRISWAGFEESAVIFASDNTPRKTK